MLPVTEQTTPSLQLRQEAGGNPELCLAPVSFLTLWAWLVDCAWLQDHHLDIHLRLHPIAPTPCVSSSVRPPLARTLQTVAAPTSPGLGPWWLGTARRGYTVLSDS